MRDRYPAVDAGTAAATEVALHSEKGPALCAFTNGSAIDRKEAKLVTVSQADGTMMTWKVTDKE